MSKNILVLGKDGMLGRALYHYLSKNPSFNVLGTTRRNKKAKNIFFDAEKFIINPRGYQFLAKFDYIINAIGIIKPYCKDNDPDGVLKAIKINALFPHLLSKFLETKKSKAKIINVATDCVFSGKTGNYTEESIHDPQDVYGKTKSLGEVDSANALNIRCSLIGPEKYHKLNLMEWFLSQKKNKSIEGFSHHRWNGVTTLQFAILCEKLVSENAFDNLRKKSSVYHFVPNNVVTKFELLNLLNKIFDKKIKINKNNKIGEPVNRVLKTKFPALTNLYGKSDLEEEIKKLKDYMRIYEKK